MEAARERGAATNGGRILDKYFKGTTRVGLVVRYLDCAWLTLCRTSRGDTARVGAILTPNKKPFTTAYDCPQAMAQGWGAGDGRIHQQATARSLLPPAALDDYRRAWKAAETFFWKTLSI